MSTEFSEEEGKKDKKGKNNPFLKRYNIRNLTYNEII